MEAGDEYRYHAETEDENDAVIPRVATPGWIQLQGPLATTNQINVYEDIYKELSVVNSSHGSDAMFTYLRNKFDGMRGNWEDMAAMMLIEGYDAVARITGKASRPIKEYKALELLIPTMNLRHPHIVTATMFYNMFDFYMDTNKPGKAYKKMEAARWAIQQHAISVWTSPVFDIQALMYDRMAQIIHTKPEKKKKYQQMAIDSYTHARQQCLNQPSQGEENYYYFPLIYTLQIVNITLDFPSLDTVRNFKDGHIIYNRFLTCQVSDDQIVEAERLLNVAKEQSETLTAGYEHYVDERVAICTIFLNIANTVVATNESNYNLAKHRLEEAKTKYSKWYDDYNERTYSDFHQIANLNDDIKKCLDHLSDLIRLRLHDPNKKYRAEKMSTTESLSSENTSISKNVDRPVTYYNMLTIQSRQLEMQNQQEIAAYVGTADINQFPTRENVSEIVLQSGNQIHNGIFETNTNIQDKDNIQQSLLRSEKPITASREMTVKSVTKPRANPCTTNEQMDSVVPQSTGNPSTENEQMDTTVAQSTDNPGKGNQQLNCSTKKEKSVKTTESTDYTSGDIHSSSGDMSSDML